MDIKKLQTTVVDALEDVKAQDIVMFDTTGLTSLFDRICIASGTSNRQTKALAASVRDKVKEAGGDVIGVEGEDTGEWVLVDLGDMIVHIMQAPIRAYYRLEEIWGEKPVKLGAAKRKSSAEGKAATEAEAAPKKKSGHLAASKAAKSAEAVIEKKAAPARKPGTVKAAAAAGAAAKKAAKKATPAVEAPEGKKVKVAASKTSVASAKAAKEAKAKSAAKAAEAPAKTVIKRIKKPAAE
ncbi:ribosome silencing factor [Pseudoduganella violacea]|uniref:Ribosomal silencing factor RsfS n=1 Tax=Pseudoduganella violacea TaxID=1715466 RepID=A0A7W5FTC0_9BURK|nr:ribosome silencing factor [Pseudoduganella violacea]MBB3118028.1 ribosome-associated protein [Pseudoduganella violacea]